MEAAREAAIAGIGVETHAVPIHVPFTISRESLPAAAVAVVRLTDAEGRSGTGEASPFPSLTHDDVPTAAAVAAGLIESLRGQTPTAGLAWLAQRQDEARRSSITAVTAVESALWDLHARQQGRSLATLWSASGAPACWSVTTDLTLPIMAPAEVPRFWERFANHRFPVVKVKVSGRLTEDLDLVRALVAEVPPGTQLTLDGNQGYGLDAAKVLVARLLAEGIRPLFFEQPLPEDDHDGLARLAASCQIPICLDETVRTPADARRAVERRLGHIVNVKTMKSGLAGAREIIDVVRAAGLELMIGGMLESEVGMGISLQLACGTGAFTHVDLDTPFFLARPLTRTSPWHAGSATLMLPPGPGHGLDLLRS